jgi:hypothetical protein
MGFYGKRLAEVTVGLAEAAIGLVEVVFGLAEFAIGLAEVVFGLADAAIGLAEAVRDSLGRRELCIITEVLNEY